MKIGIVIGTNEPEAVWNAFRFGVTALKSAHEVNVFLMNKGVEAEDIEDEKYDVKEQIGQYLSGNGSIRACGTCLKARQKEASNACLLSTMKDLLGMVEESDRLLTFG